MSTYAHRRDDSLFTAGQIETSLAGTDVVAAGLDDDRSDLLARLDRGGFDQAPVKQGQRTLGCVRTSDLQAGSTVESAMTLLSDTPIVAASAPMSQVLGLLQDGLVFTVRGEGLSGFITPSDLERHAARAHFYLLIAEVEMQLSSLVHRNVSEPAIIAQIERRRETRQRWEAARMARAESRPVEYLYLSDLKKLFLNHVDNLPDHASRQTLDDVVTLRNQVMHPTKPMLGERGPAELARLDLAIRRLRDLLATLSAKPIGMSHGLSVVTPTIQP